MKELNVKAQITEIMNSNLSTYQKADEITNLRPNDSWVLFGGMSAWCDLVEKNDIHAMEVALESGRGDMLTCSCGMVFCTCNWTQEKCPHCKSAELHQVAELEDRILKLKRKYKGTKLYRFLERNGIEVDKFCISVVNSNKGRA